MPYRKLIYEELVPSAIRTTFVKKVIDVAEKIGANPDWVMLVMKKESGINPAAVNKFSNATGLIQFMPTTATGLGTTVDALKKMTHLQQLDYVYRYYKKYPSNKYNSFYDLYLATFYPAALGKPDSYVFGSESGIALARKIKTQNPAIGSYSSSDTVNISHFKKYTDDALAKSGIQKSDVTQKDLALKIVKNKSFATATLIILPIVLGVGLYWYFVYRKTNKLPFVK